MLNPTVELIASVVYRKLPRNLSVAVAPRADKPKNPKNPKNHKNPKNNMNLEKSYSYYLAKVIVINYSRFLDKKSITSLDIRSGYFTL